MLLKVGNWHLLSDYVVDVVQDIHTRCIFIKTLFYFIDIPKIYLTPRTNILTTLPQYNSNFHTTTLFSWTYWHVNRINLSPLFVIPRTNYDRLFGGLLSSFSLPSFFSYLFLVKETKYVRYFISQIPLQLEAPSKFSSGQWDKPESCLGRKRGGRKGEEGEKNPCPHFHFTWIWENMMKIALVVKLWPWEEKLIESSRTQYFDQNPLKQPRNYPLLV